MALPVPNDRLDLCLRNSLQSLSNLFLQAIEGESISLTTFDKQWAAFGETLVNCSNQLHSETLNLVYEFASTVSAVTSGMLDLQAASSGMCRQFESDMEDILRDGLGQLSTDNHDTTHHSPAYIEPSARWLLANIHNPYPPVELRKRIATETSSSRKDIDAWFVDARRRIGWNSLRKKRFGNRRTGIVDAATRFFIKHESLDSMLVESEFVALESSAHTLFSHKLGESVLAHELDLAVKDLTPDLHLQVSQAKRRENRRAAESYPTPERSPTSTASTSLPSPCSSPVSAVSELPSSTEINSRKRRRHSCDGDSEREYRRPPYLSSSPISSLGVLPPASSSEEIGSSDFLKKTVNPEVSQSSKRKRRLSGAYSEPQAKRTQTIPSPVVHSISKALPASTLEEWISSFTSAAPFEMCAPVASVEAPDSTDTLQIELFDFSSCSDARDKGTIFQPTTSLDSVLSTASAFHDSSNFNDGHSLALNSDDFDWLSLNASFISTTYDIPLSFTLPTLQQSQPSNVSPNNTPFDLVFDSSIDWSPPPISFSTPGIATLSTTATYKDNISLTKEQKKRELKELEAKLLVIRAEIDATP